MNPELEKILSCPTLPSLPAVALRVIEQTSDENVSLRELARTIENDQGLSAKILKTVNSSFYGLRQRCASIDKALVLLGLSPVKCLALGFSLIDVMQDPSGRGGFDYVAYWRRGLYTGIAGKFLSERAGMEIGDEIFLGGLLQDVGMVAMHLALGQDYLDVLGDDASDHRTLVQRELEGLDLQHPQVGAMLVQRWKLPAELVMPVKYHERPSAAPGSCVDHVRFVGLGNYVHDALTLEDNLPPLRRLYEKARAWYRFTAEDVDAVLARVSESVGEMASLFRLDVGPYTDASAVLADSRRRAASMVSANPGDATVFSHAQEGSALAGSELDPVTGTIGPVGFEVAVREGFRLAREQDEPLALVEVVIDGYERLEAEQGACADTEAVMEVAGLLRIVFEGHGGAVCHVSPGTFAVVLPGTGRLTAANLAESFRSELVRCLPEWTAPATDRPLSFTTSIGVVALEEPTRQIFDEPGKLVRACARALQAGQAGGGGGMCVFEPKARAA